mgnify:CR=1 FL=1
MALDTTNLKIGDINTEVTAVNSHNLKTLSLNAISAGTGTPTQMIRVNPYGMGEFRGYTHNIYQGTGTVSYFSSQYVNTSAIVFASGNNLTMQGVASSLAIANINGGIMLSFSTQGSTYGLYTNSGWTNLKVFGNGSFSGTPILDLNRSACTFTVSNNGSGNAIAYWTSASIYSNFSVVFGQTAGQARSVRLT